MMALLPTVRHSCMRSLIPPSSHRLIGSIPSQICNVDVPVMKLLAIPWACEDFDSSG